MTDSLTVITDVVKALGDVPNIPQAIAAFKGASLKTRVIETIIIFDDLGKIAGIFVPPVAVIANDVGIAIELEQVLEPVVGPVIQKISAPVIGWIEHELGHPTAPAATHRGATRPLLLLPKP